MSRSVSDFSLKNLFLVKVIKQKYATGCFYDSNTHFEMLVDQISLISPEKDLSSHQNKRSNFLKCSSISICVMFCFANINIRADASTIYFWNNLNIPTSSATLSYERLFSEGTLFPWGENGEDMLHHKNQGTDNPMFCWKFLHDSYINNKTESAHWE